ncbi:MAG: hypothetical protein LBE35_08455 [Clostridiales bacterium]|jgi:cytochrome b561|nr:hypothetical protein [Clostridiales bacterium]
MSSNFIKRFSLIKDILMFICLIMLMLTPYLMRWEPIGRAWYLLGWNWHLASWHQLFGIILAVLFVIHIALNFKWLTGVMKSWAKSNTATKAKFWMMILVCVFMSASIITGIVWGLSTGARPAFESVITLSGGFGSGSPIAFWHTITSWAAFYFTGIHIGLHLPKFLSFAAKPKPKPAAAAPKAN